MAASPSHTHNTVTSSYRPSISQTLSLWGYSSLLALLIPFAFLNLLLRAVIRHKDYNARRFERFGFVPAPPQQGGLLVHCVSVGEVTALTPLLKWLQKNNPELPLTVTTTTPTGSKRLRDTFGDAVHHFYLPYDLHMAMHGMLKRIQPSKVLIAEVELWPNLVHACWKHNIPVYQVNGRLTDRATQRYKKLAALFVPMMKKISGVCAQSQRDATNYLTLGLNPNKLTLCGNMKFDVPKPTSSSEIANALARIEDIAKGKRVLMAGSTHSADEKVLLPAFKELGKRYPELMLIIAPRKIQRAERLQLRATKAGFSVQRLSTLSPERAADILIIDSLGLLAQAYSLASIAVVGGSFANKGGHNPLEACAHGVPVIMGPNTDNLVGVRETLEQAKALTIVADSHQLYKKIDTLLTDDKQRLSHGLAGKDVMEKNRGALEKTLEAINSTSATAACISPANHSTSPIGKKTG